MKYTALDRAFTSHSSVCLATWDQPKEKEELADLAFCLETLQETFFFLLSQKQKKVKTPVPTLSYLSIFSIQMPGFSMANLSQLVAGYTPSFTVNFIDSLECHSEIKISHNSYLHPG